MKSFSLSVLLPARAPPSLCSGPCPWLQGHPLYCGWLSSQLHSFLRTPHRCHSPELSLQTFPAEAFYGVHSLYIKRSPAWRRQLSQESAHHTTMRSGVRILSTHRKAECGATCPLSQCWGDEDRGICGAWRSDSLTKCKLQVLQDPFKNKAKDRWAGSVGKGAGTHKVEKENQVPQVVP